MTRLAIPFTARSTAADVLAGVDLTGRHYLVTGGTSGIGLATAEALRAAGAAVTATTRRDVDLADLDSVRAFTAAWTGRLDAVVANAGVMALPTLQRARNGWELQLATNYLGHFALLGGLRRHLTGGRVVIVSSGAQLSAGVDFDDPQFERRAYDPWVAYAQSKTADVLLAVGIADRWAADGIVANALAPGRIHTNLQRHIGAAEMRALGAMDEDGNLVHADGFKTPEQGAAASVLLAASPLTAGMTGQYIDEDVQQAHVVPGGTGLHHGAAHWSMDRANADRLWALGTDALADRN
ncbi:SDR family NAD(P)-dependent oxidoreductase [Actinoplanes sp. DH11]|uniref:SDR family NAD(P)-dependent oxidoreductase n=1 Tax=Actinoplanes sp. DH11 TaxID=2857011 RepID=UPI001E379393|nr:SDR family NAD(P)-dependent oxidoreductase [Actinoplanes sp. DH11]